MEVAPPTSTCPSAPTSWPARAAATRVERTSRIRERFAVSSPQTDPTPEIIATSAAPVTGTARVKRGMAEMLKGGVIMDVVTPEQARIAEDAGAVAVMALERVPADIRAQGGVARMSDPDMIDGIINAVSIPVKIGRASCRKPST